MSDIKGNILVVDDVQMNLHLLSATLGQYGYKVRPVPSGELALRAVEAATPDLILLDINMPGMSGYEVCARLKANEHTRDIPIIFLSAMDEASEKVRAFEAGGVDYITKPFQFQEVLVRIETHLSLSRYTAQLEARNEELDAFAGMVAHDLRSPLALIISTAQLMQLKYGGVLGDDGKETAQRIVESGWQMSAIIDALLRLARIRDESPPLVPIDMAIIVGTALVRHESARHTTNARLHVPDTWPVALGHSAWVEEVWVNYLGNALKYGGPQPVITVGADTLPTGEIRFFVRDEGPGISAIDQARLFTPFTRLHDGKVEGHGLGLSIVKRIVQKLGGTVGVDSILGAGATFWFTLPAA